MLSLDHALANKHMRGRNGWLLDDAGLVGRLVVLLGFGILHSRMLALLDADTWGGLDDGANGAAADMATSKHLRKVRL